MCNDGKCPLNRQGTPHESHDIIENRPVSEPCNDPRCPMNRMGTRHESHKNGWVKEPVGHAPEAESRRVPPTYGHRPGKKNDSGLTKDELDEMARRLRQKTQSSGSAGAGHSTRTAPARPGRGTQSHGTETIEHRILHSKDPHDVLGVSRSAPYTEIKSKYRELVREYDSSRGILHKSPAEKERSNKIMTSVNHAFAQLKRMHAGGRA